MNYEQKYKEALERAMEYWETDNDNTLDIKAKGTMEFLFPELAESGGERIRKEILEYFQQFENEELRGVNISDWIAWLEKLKVFAEHGDGLYYFANSEFTYVGNPTWDNVSFLEKQGEQKPFDYENATIVQKDFAPNKEPKFNIGDWIVSDKMYISNDYRLCKVVGISDGCYTIQTIGGLKGYNTFKEWEIDYHLWSIADAKDGDVLYYKAENGIEYIVMSKGLNEYNNIDSYFRYNSINGFGIDIPSVLSAKCDSITPATKEQRDILFQKMKEAGYTFDFESKELKKIEQKPILDVEIPFGAKDSELYEVSYYIPKGFHAEIEDNKVVIKRGEQKPTLAANDDEEFEIAINALKGAGQYDSAAWLQTIKQRIGG